MHRLVFLYYGYIRRGGGGGALEKISTDQRCSCYFFGLKFDKSLFFGMLKMRVFIIGD